MYACRWSRCFGAGGVPSDNNACERNNRDLKDYGTMRERSTPTAFLETALKMWLKDKSMEYELECWQTDPLVDTNEWRKAQRKHANSDFWKMCFFPGQLTIMPSKRTFNSFVGVSNRAEVLQAACDKYLGMPESCDGLSFHEYMAVYYSFFVLTKLPRSQRTVHTYYSCSCPLYAHYRVCNHSLALGLRNKDFTLPKTKELRVIGSVKTVGRPPLPENVDTQRARARAVPSQGSRNVARRQTQTQPQKCTQKRQTQKQTQPQAQTQKRGGGPGRAKQAKAGHALLRD